MVCPRCIAKVSEILLELDIPVTNITLGNVSTTHELTNETKQALKASLENYGFELLEDKKAILIAKVKALLIDQIHHPTTSLNSNYSSILSENLNQDYIALSKLFSSVEGITIEKFILKQKIEKVKELIIYDELNFSEIADLLNYSSVAHLSSQFKKETGMTPTAFKKLDFKNRSSLDSL